MRVRVALVLAAAFAAACTAAIGLAAGSAGAAASYCASGTAIAVDFAHWDGPVVRGCDNSSPKTGADLLTDEGFRLAGQAFICGIGSDSFNGGAPLPTAQGNCHPSVSAYWSYWLSNGSDGWTYSTLGVTSDHPVAGGIELWIFGGSANPTCTPDSIRDDSAGHCSPVGSPVKTTPSHSPTPSTSHQATSPTTHGAAGSSHASSPAGSSTPTAHRTGASSTSGAPGSATTRPTGTTGSSTPPGGALAIGGVTSDPSSTGGGVVNAKPAAKSHHSAGSAAPVITTVAILAVLIAGAGYTRWRRTRPSTD